MPWDGRTADSVWLRCHDCEPPRNFREVDYRHHVNTEHPERPEEDAMTLAEVATVLGTYKRHAHRLIKTGRLRSFRVPQGKLKVWVRRKDLKSYMRSEIEVHPELAMKWAGAL